MARNVIIRITYDSQKPNKDGYVHLKLRIWSGKKKISRIGVKVNLDHWDEKHGHIHVQHREKYPNETKYIDEIYSRTTQVRLPLANTEMSVSTAFEILKGSVVEKGSVLQYAQEFQPDSKTRKQSTIRKHIQNINAIESALKKYGMSSYVPLEFSHLQDETCIERIGTVITTKMGLKTNTQAGYMKSLNWVCTKTKQKVQNPFTYYGLMVTEKPSGKNVPIDNTDLQIGFNNINTLHQFESLLFWLYSFCLMGLDGVDIAGLREKDIVNDAFTGDLTDYIPDGDILGSKDYSQPLHVHIKRSKTVKGATDSGVDAVVQVNLFPTVLVYEMLKHTIKHNANGYAYTGKDKIRLYNFDPRTDDGFEKWRLCSNTYSSILSDKVGTTIQQTRHTVTNVAGQLGMSQDDVDRLLNHTIKGANVHYWTKQQTITDVAQMHIFQEYGVIEIVKHLIEHFKNKVDVVDNKEIPYIPKSLLQKKVSGRTVSKVHRIQMFEINRLTNFNRNDEIRYQTYLKKVQKGRTVPVDGVMVNVPIEPKNYPKELQELIAKRKGLYDVDSGSVKVFERVTEKLNLDVPFSQDVYDGLVDAKKVAKRDSKVVNISKNAG